jgi:pyridoxal phosphate enzyme (YggS family)
MEDVRANLERVRERIARAARRSGRRPEDILLIAVSKTVPADRLRDAIAAGVPALGENRVQEARGKIAVLGRPVPWHLIGHLQTNKVTNAIELFDVIQSVDRLPLAHELSKRAPRPVDVLVQVNVGEEVSKGGFAPREVKSALDAIQALPGLRVRGLMAIPPAVEDPELARPWFRVLRELRAATGLAELSMGMSGDFEVAIEEGATMVRIGTAIFGERSRRP